MNIEKNETSSKTIISQYSNEAFKPINFLVRIIGNILKILMPSLLALSYCQSPESQPKFWRVESVDERIDRRIEPS